MERHLFLVSKPIQFIIQKTVLEKNLKDSDLFYELWIVGSFYKSNCLYEKLCECPKPWQRVKYFKNKYFAYLSLLKFNFKYIYIDSDFGLINGVLFILKLLGVKIFVVEEGSGIYSTDLLLSFDKLSGVMYHVKSFLYYRILGSGRYLGDSRWVHGIYIFDDIKYLLVHANYKKKIFRIGESLKGQILNNLEYYFNLFSLDRVLPLNEIEGAFKVFVYSASFNVNYDFVFNLYDYDLLLIKLHPSVEKFKFKNIPRKNIKFVKTSAPTEVIAYYLLQLGKIVKVFHENSSVGEYLDKDVEVINIIGK